MSTFTSGIIDIGMVVRDIDESVAFYRDAIGFTEVSTFDVPAELATETGLTINRAFAARVMQLGDTEGGTRLKLIEMHGVPRCCDTSYLHSVTGYRYLTVRVADMEAAIARARAAGVEPEASGPVEAPPPFKPNTWIAILHDPDGNMVELIGPKKTP